MKKILLGIITCYSLSAVALPKGFVYLKEIDPSILQEMRYAGYYNFVGRPIIGYKVGTCILTRQAAYALRQVQDELKPQGLSLKVYDCYRPMRAVEDFVKWSKSSHDIKMKNEFYPRVDKDQLFSLGYISRQSAHSRGSTVDLTIVNSASPLQTVGGPKTRKKLTRCYAPRWQRVDDNSIDMGTGYDCMDRVASYASTEVNRIARNNRLLLQRMMSKHGFMPYEKEWWHFSLKKEPSDATYHNFLVR